MTRISFYQLLATSYGHFTHYRNVFVDWLSLSSKLQQTRKCLTILDAYLYPALTCNVHIKHRRAKLRIRAKCIHVSRMKNSVSDYKVEIMGESGKKAFNDVFRRSASGSTSSSWSERQNCS